MPHLQVSSLGHSGKAERSNWWLREREALVGTLKDWYLTVWGAMWHWDMKGAFGEKTNLDLHPTVRKHGMDMYTPCTCTHTVFKTDNQQGPSVQHGELCSYSVIT